MIKGYKGKKSKIETEAIFSINDNMIPMLGYNDRTTRYLGVDFTSIGAINVQKVKREISDALDKLEHLKLKAQCQEDGYPGQQIRSDLTGSDHPTKSDRIRDRSDKILYWIRWDPSMGLFDLGKRILHLPVLTSNEFFYLPIKEDGLQLMNIRETVSLSKIKLYKKIMSGYDPVLRYLVQTQKNRIIDHFIINLNLEQSLSLDDVNQIKDKLVKDKRNSFIQKIHGVGFEVFSTSPLTNKWMKRDIRTMSTRTFINSIKLRTNTLETRVTTTTGLITNKVCRGCHQADESLMHVLQVYPTTKGLRINRHHILCVRIATKLQQKNYEVHREESYPDPNNTDIYLRPDLIAIKPGNIMILDVTIVYEISAATFINAYRNKSEKYNPIITQVMQKYYCHIRECHGMVIGPRGSIHASQLRHWHNIGMSSTKLIYTSIGCMEDSLKIMAIFQKTNL
ncbi:unnamed protein product [Adineta ricciae]|uniref:Uncharacterized protein n=1 Tax=Adineta ricciae TaxID=249248 RepID=A0A814YME4_ADIRI|nr:unnamed protein product [Adineta ricciae]